MLTKLLSAIRSLFHRQSSGRTWACKTLVVGPSQPVDGDSVACTKALITHLRNLGKQAFTLPTLHSYPQLAWILSKSDLHQACLPFATPELICTNLQDVYDAMLSQWRPDEIVLVDGQIDRLGFDRRGVPLFTIDHHVGSGTRDDSKAYIQAAPSAACLLIQRYCIYDPVLVVSVLSDTFWLRRNMPATAIDSLYALRKHGCLSDEALIDIQSKLMVAKDPDIVGAVRSSDLRYDRQSRSVFAAMTTCDHAIHRDVVALLGYYFHNLCVVRGDGYVSFTTRERDKSVRSLAIACGGGGHDHSAAALLDSMERPRLDELCATFMSHFACSQ